MSGATPDPSPPRIVVLGAGVAGLYAGRVLAEAGAEVTVVEKEPILGGLAASYQQNGNAYDLGVHHLHGHDPEILQDIQRLFADELNSVRKSAKIRFGKGYRSYPLKFFDLLTGVPAWFLVRAVTAMVLQQSRNKISAREPKNAEEALIQLYGRPLYEYFFRDFTESYWGFPTSHLSAEFIRAKMPRLSAIDMARRALVKMGLAREKEGAVASATAEETLYYGSGGAGELPTTLARFVTERGGRVLTESPVVALERDGTRVTAVHCRRGSEALRLPCDRCISTIPIPDLCRALEPAAPEEILAAADKLQYKSLAVISFLVKRTPLLPALYVHFRNRMFHRASEPRLSGLRVSPEGHSILVLETTCDVGDERWRGDPSIIEQAIQDLEKDRILRREEIVDTHHGRYQHAYPIFDIGFEDRKKTLLDYLGGFENLESTGAQGTFTYPSMHGAMRLAAGAAETALQMARAEQSPWKGQPPSVQTPACG